MKKLKIRTRMTLLYTAMLMIFMIVCFVAIAIVFSKNLQNEAHTKLIRDAFVVADEVDYDDGELEIDLEEDDLENIDNSDLFSLYSLDDELVDRNHHQNWVEILPKELGNIRSVEHDDAQWLVYDTTVFDHEEEIAWLRITAPLSAIQDATNQLWSISLWSLLIGLIFSIICGQWIAWRALAPIQKITNAAKEIGEGDLSRRLDFANSNDEVGELAKTFDAMLDNVESAFVREKQFTSDASHELRTPIAVIMAYAEESLRNKNASKEEYQEALEVIYQKSQDMHRMLSQLLWLARGYEQDQAIEMDQLDISIALADITEEMTDRAKEKNIKIALDIQEGIIMNADLMLFTRMIINLIENAVKYGKEHGHIWVSLKKIVNEENLEKIQLIIRDDGQGMSEEDVAHIFERFYRSDRARSGNGFGLGLPIVAFIVQCHKGSIHVSSELDKGTIFTLYF